MVRYSLYDLDYADFSILIISYTAMYISKYT